MLSSRSAASGAKPSFTSVLKMSATEQPRATLCATHSFHSCGSSVYAIRSWTACTDTGSGASAASLQVPRHGARAGRAELAELRGSANLGRQRVTRYRAEPQSPEEILSIGCQQIDVRD